MEPKKLKQHEEHFNQDSSIHNVFSWLFFAMQIFGFMPLQGIFKKHLTEIRYSWTSFRALYALITCVGLFFMMAIQVIRFLLFTVEMIDVQRFWYFAKAWFVSMFFIFVAKDWNNFLKKWNKLDVAIMKFGKPIPVKGKLLCLLGVFVTLFIGDYILIQVQRVQEDILKGNVVLSWDTWNRLQKNKIFKYVYVMFPYDFVSGICLLVVQLQVLFSGTFLDLFIMGISLCLASRMRLITKKIQQVATGDDVPEHVWIHLREGYNGLELLCHYINSKIGLAILICFIGNLGIILINLFHNLKADKSYIQKSYLYYSFFFVLAKTVSVCIFGSKIHDESRKPLTYLYAIGDSAYNVEIKRLTSQIARDTLALSGMNFFQLRRNMLLKIAGSIVTYELVLIEFAGDFLKEHQTVNRTTTL